MSQTTLHISVPILPHANLECGAIRSDSRVQLKELGARQPELSLDARASVACDNGVPLGTVGRALRVRVRGTRRVV